MRSYAFARTKLCGRQPQAVMSLLMDRGLAREIRIGLILTFQTRRLPRVDPLYLGVPAV